MLFCFSGQQFAFRSPQHAQCHTQAAFAISRAASARRQGRPRGTGVWAKSYAESRQEARVAEVEKPSGRGRRRAGDNPA